MGGLPIFFLASILLFLSCLLGLLSHRQGNGYCLLLRLAGLHLGLDVAANCLSRVAFLQHVLKLVSAKIGISQLPHTCPSGSAIV